METAMILEISKEALYVLLKVTMPALLITLVVGILISLFQALTQIQENTLTFVPKIVVLFAALIFLGPYMISTLQVFFTHINEIIISGMGGAG
jgi:flagellar biosynthetic protein FliQ